MLIDYLRHLAFAGSLRQFFIEQYLEFVDEPSDVTGQHLRFREHDPLSSRRYMHKDYLDWAEMLGIGQYPAHTQLPGFAIGGPPPTFPYSGYFKEEPPFEIEILIDIAPDRWDDYSKREVRYEAFRIRFRPAGYARGQIGMGEKLYREARDRSKFGTLCGAFSSVDGGLFGLTCGHVANIKDATIFADRRRRFWEFGLGSALVPIGCTAHIADLSQFHQAQARKPRGNVTSRLDAALITLDHDIDARVEHRERSHTVHSAPCIPVLEMLQEAKVGFLGAARRSPTAARISGVTVWKSIDLYGDGVMYEIGDVLMIGHPQKAYFSRSVSRPGDSGSAIVKWEGYSDTYWYGMLLGADEEATYASYAEQIWAWAATQIADPHLDFYI